MRLKIRLVAGFLSLAAILIAGAAMATVGIDGSGVLGTCPVKGSIKLKPALVTGGALAGEIKASVKVSATKGVVACSGGTGDGANVVRFTAKGTGTTAANNCINQGGATSTNLVLTIKWKVSKGSPKLNPSTATFTINPGSVATDGNDTLDLAGIITAGSFNGNQITAQIETDQTDAILQADCGAKGIKKMTFGANHTVNSCMVGPNLRAAITKQITTIDSGNVPNLQVEITTRTALPFQLTESTVTSPTNVQLSSVSSTCSVNAGDYLCMHEAFFQSTAACTWDGDYVMSLSYGCYPNNSCALCNEKITIPFSLTSENFCMSGIEFCVPNLTCSSSLSIGGEPCCSLSYAPLISCLSQNCATECADYISGMNGFSTACTDCAVTVLENGPCVSQVHGCMADGQFCPP